MGERVLFARVGRRHGLAGEFYLDIFSPVPDRLPELYTGDHPDECDTSGSVTVEIAELKRAAKRWLAKFKGSVDEMTGKYLWADKWDPGRDVFWTDDIMGCMVVDASGGLIGEVESVSGNMPQIWVTVKTANNREFRIPFLKKFVKDVSVSSKKIVVDVPDGVGVWKE